MKPEDFVAPNKDRLADLSERHTQAQARLLAARKRLEDFKELMRPEIEAVDSAEYEVENIRCRLHTFWSAYRHEAQTH